MTLRKMNIDRDFIIAQASDVSPERKFGFYRWIIRICKEYAQKYRNILAITMGDCQPRG